MQSLQIAVDKKVAPLSVNGATVAYISISYPVSSANAPEGNQYLLANDQKNLPEGIDYLLEHCQRILDNL
jgi:hypothetical protein